MARPDRAPEIEAALLRAVGEHPHDLVRMVAAQLGLSRQRVAQVVQGLVAGGYLDKAGTTRPTYALGAKRRFRRTYPRGSLDEHVVWFDQLLPMLGELPANVREIAGYGVTEMVNNAVDHSDAAHVTVLMDFDGERLALAVLDDGIGIFRKISRALDLTDERLALLELAKGKLSTDPARHSGEGIFFTSRMFDRFQLRSGRLVFDHDERFGDDLLDEFSERTPDHGTGVFMEIEVSSRKRMREVFDAFSSGPDDHAFAKTIVPMRLARIGDENLISRSQAKRVLQRVDRFRTVVFDFEGVASIGQAFADEIFRVFANAHPEVELIPIHAASEVQQMIRRAEVLRDEQGGQLPLLK